MSSKPQSNIGLGFDFSRTFGENGEYVGLPHTFMSPWIKFPLQRNSTKFTGGILYCRELCPDDFIVSQLAYSVEYANIARSFLAGYRHSPNRKDFHMKTKIASSSFHSFSSKWLRWLNKLCPERHATLQFRGSLSGNELLDDQEEEEEGVRGNMFRSGVTGKWKNENLQVTGAAHVGVTFPQHGDELMGASFVGTVGLSYKPNGDDSAFRVYLERTGARIYGVESMPDEPMYLVGPVTSGAVRAGLGYNGFKNARVKGFVDTRGTVSAECSLRTPPKMIKYLDEESKVTVKLDYNWFEMRTSFGIAFGAK